MTCRVSCHQHLRLANLLLQVATDLLLDMYPIPITRAALDQDLAELQAAGFLSTADHAGSWAFTQASPPLLTPSKCM